MNYYLKSDYKKWHAIDFDFIYKIIVIFVFAIALLLATAKSVLFVQNIILEKIEIFNQSQQINQEFQKLYSMQEKFGEKLIEEEQIRQLKLIYNSEEINLQQMTIIKTSAEIAKRICPIGSWVLVEIDNKRYPVKVNGFYGYQASTKEGINFMVTDENWHFLKKWEYKTLGGKF